MVVKINISEIKEIVRKLLSDKRYNHSLEVAKQAVKLAKKHGADEKKAEIAGLLHDIMKEEDDDVQLKIITQAGIELDEIELKTKKLWHQIAGMAYSRDTLKIDDDEILSAIRYHTSGSGNMTLLDKVLFIADFTSEDRDYNGVKEMRKSAIKNLDEAVLKGLSFTIMELAEEEQLICRDSINAYNRAIIDTK